MALNSLSNSFNISNTGNQGGKVFSGTLFKNKALGTLLIFLLILLVIFSIVMIVIAVSFPKRVDSKGSNEEVLLNFIHNCKNNPLEISTKAISASSSGNEYSLTFWFFINDLDSNYLKDQSYNHLDILSKGKVDPKVKGINTNNPQPIRIFMEEKSNSLRVELQDQSTLTDYRNATGCYQSTNAIAAKDEISKLKIGNELTTPEKCLEEALQLNSAYFGMDQQHKCYALNYLDINTLTTGGKYTKVTDDSQKNRDDCIGDSSSAAAHQMPIATLLKPGGAVDIKNNIPELKKLKPSDTASQQASASSSTKDGRDLAIQYKILNGKVTDVKVKAGSEGSGYVADEIVDILIPVSSGVDETLKVKLKDADLTNKIKTLPDIASGGTIVASSTSLEGLVKFKGDKVSIDVNLVDNGDGVHKGAKARLELKGDSKKENYIITAAISSDNQGSGYVVGDVLKIPMALIVLEDEKKTIYNSTEDIVFPALTASNLQSLKTETPLTIYKNIDQVIANPDKKPPDSENKDDTIEFIFTFNYDTGVFAEASVLKHTTASPSALSDDDTYDFTLTNSPISFHNQTIAFSALQVALTQDSIQTDDNYLYVDNVTASSSYKPCRVNQVPIQRWNCITLNVHNNIADLFMDGKLLHTCVHSNNIILNNDPIIIGNRGGFDGYVSNVTWSTKALGANEIYDRYSTGPRIRLTANERIKYMFMKKPKDVQESEEAIEYVNEQSTGRL